MSDLTDEERQSINAFFRSQLEEKVMTDPTSAEEKARELCLKVTLWDHNDPMSCPHCCHIAAALLAAHREVVSNGGHCAVCGFQYREFNGHIIPCPVCAHRAVEVQLLQHRGALGYAVPGGISDDPTIKNGIAEALAKQLREAEDRVCGVRTALEKVVNFLDFAKQPAPTEIEKQAGGWDKFKQSIDRELHTLLNELRQILSAAPACPHKTERDWWHNRAYKSEKAAGDARRGWTLCERQLAEAKQSVAETNEIANDWLHKHAVVTVALENAKRRHILLSEQNEERRVALGETQDVLGAWQTIFGTTQLYHAQARLEAAERGAQKLRAEVEKLNKIAKIDAANYEARCKVVDEASSENATLRDRNEVLEKEIKQQRELHELVTEYRTIEDNMRQPSVCRALVRFWTKMEKRASEAAALKPKE